MRSSFFLSSRSRSWIKARLVLIPFAQLEFILVLVALSLTKLFNWTLSSRFFFNIFWPLTLLILISLPFLPKVLTLLRTLVSSPLNSSRILSHSMNMRYCLEVSINWSIYGVDFKKSCSLSPYCSNISSSMYSISLDACL